MAELVAPSGKPAGRRPRPSPLRSTSRSPSRAPQAGDDLLAGLWPDTALDALQSPNESMKACLAHASASERTFAFRTATASKEVYEWVQELSGWPWPAEGGSGGYEVPPPEKRKIHATPKRQQHGDVQKTAHNTTKDDPFPESMYRGSLLADDVALYEKRVEQIHSNMEQLHLEEIKNQVLHNHIRPMSRPGTPFSDSGISTISAATFARLEDVTAVITTITVRALPLLQELSRLLNVWSIRLAVLNKIPSLFAMLADAESALRSAWDTIESAKLTSHDFEVMKKYLEPAITEPGKKLDDLLNMLERTADDTLPDDWLERMEAIERDYVKWMTTAEERVREGELPRSSESTKVVESAVDPRLSRPKIQIQEPSPIKATFEISDNDQSTSRTVPNSRKPAPTEENGEPLRNGTITILIDEPSSDIQQSSSQVLHLTQLAAHQRDVDSGAVVKDPSLDYVSVADQQTPRAKSSYQGNSNILKDAPKLSFAKGTRRSTYDGSEDLEASDSDEANPILSEVDRNIVRPARPEVSRHESIKPSVEDDFEPSVLESVDEEEEYSELDASQAGGRAGSRSSLSSSPPRRYLGSQIDRSDSEPPREGSVDLELPSLPDPDEPFSSDGLSPPSSPPVRWKPRTTSVTFKDGPEVAQLSDRNNTPPRSLRESPDSLDREVSVERDSQLNSSRRLSTASTTTEGEDPLYKQIRNVLQSVPAKIEIKKPSKVNLNPPDFQNPSRMRKRASDPKLRSGSSLSSRAGTPSYSRSGTPFSRSGTPSFMLQQERDPRPRSRSSQGIQVYHLTGPSGERPVKLFVRSVGSPERVMVRVGGGWADLAEFLRDYATHHSRQTRGESKVEVRDARSPSPGYAVGNSSGAHMGSSPPSRPGSVLDGPMTPLAVRKTRRTSGYESLNPRTPMPVPLHPDDSLEAEDPPSGCSHASSSGVNWDEEDISLGMAGPKGVKRAALSEESRKWVEGIKEQVRAVSSTNDRPPTSMERQRSTSALSNASEQLQRHTHYGGLRTKKSLEAPGFGLRHKKSVEAPGWGDIGSAGGTKRVYRRH
ncbi:hypothetical protein F4780DRAFT_436071 [Xylariomycetidae sp. FL0641]|nr:hypothetical protein F4780DRAFT_436071 [Xylariomycetidae sp. FL0641]